MKARSLLPILLTILALYTLSSALQPPETRTRPSTLAYSEFLSAVKAGDVRQVQIQGQRIIGERAGGQPFTTFAPEDPGLIGDLVDAGVAIDAVPPPEPSVLGRLLTSMLPLLLIIGVWVYLSRRAARGGPAAGLFNVGKSKARRIEGGRVRSASASTRIDET